MSKQFYNLNKEQSLKKLKSSKIGLKQSRIKALRKKYGPNALPKDKKMSFFRIFFRQFASVLIYILLAASGISVFLREWVDATVIGLAILINVIVGFIQEAKAEKSLEKLQENLRQEAKVLRDGREVLIPVENIVPGDILILEAGDMVPADARIIQDIHLEVSEAVLTGESEPQAKHSRKLKSTEVILPERDNMVFKGTLVSSGKGQAVVVAIGLNTELGAIAKILKQSKDRLTPLQKKMNNFSKILGLAVLFFATIIVAIGLYKGQDFWEIFLVAVAVAVSAVPEGLMVGITVILAVGMQRILKRKALVRRLVATETLGSTSVVCVDKTGTLTKGEMEVREWITAGASFTQSKKHKMKPEIEIMIRNAVLCNDAAVSDGDLIIGSATEAAIVRASEDAGIDIDSLKKRNPRVEERPFDSKEKSMITVHKDGKRFLHIQKGAPEKILSLSDRYIKSGKPAKLSPAQAEKFQKQFNKYSKQGYRLLAVAYKYEEDKKITNTKNYIFQGFIIIRDPMREQVKNTVKLAKEAGLRTIMITGDHKLTAVAIAREAGIDAQADKIMEGSEVDALSDAGLKNKVKKITVYARVSPEHKLRIVKAWQAHGQVVAMTGDGVNDAPALKIADIGIAVGSGTDVTKQTADMVLLDSNFSVIIEAIRQGRLIFQNIKKLIVYLLADAFSEVILVVGSLFMGLPLPITAAQILWINIVTDGFPAMALTQEKAHEDVMKEKPRPREASVLDTEMKALIFIIGVVTDLVLLGLFYYLYNFTGHDIAHIRTIIFAALALDSLLYVFSCKSLKKGIWQVNIFDNKYLLGGVALGLAVQLSAMYVPVLREIFELSLLNAGEWLLIAGLAVFKLILIEITKHHYNKK